MYGRALFTANDSPAALPGCQHALALQCDDHPHTYDTANSAALVPIVSVLVCVLLTDYALECWTDLLNCERSAWIADSSCDVLGSFNTACTRIVPPQHHKTTTVSTTGRYQCMLYAIDRLRY